MKRLILLIALSTIASVSMAQWVLQAQYNMWLPTGKYNGELKPGFMGAGVEAKYVIDDHLVATIGGSYTLLNYKTVLVDRVEQDAETYSSNATLQIIPMTLGADVYFNTEKVRPYLDMDFGVAMVSQKGDNLPEKDMAFNPFISPGLGVEYALRDDLKLNFVVKQHVLIYNYDDRPKQLETFTAVGINLGATYKF
jgi:hypothetical protein